MECIVTKQQSGANKQLGDKQDFLILISLVSQIIDQSSDLWQGQAES